MGPHERDAAGYFRFRKRRDNRRLYVAFAFSALLHLSMVTVFSVVIHFPRYDLQYRNFTIVPIVVSARDDMAPAPEAPVNASEAAPEQLSLRDPAAAGGLGEIQLPTLEFAELERLRVRQESSRALSRYDELFQRPEQDSWARFSRSLSGLTRSLSDFTLSGEDEEGAGSLALGGQDAPRATHRPAEGFEAFIVWAGEPRDRQLLFAPPIEAFWNLDPASLNSPIEVVMQVNALGRVVNVFSPNIDGRELIDAVQLTALQYRFEPLALEEGAMQTGTLRIQRERVESRP